jgi:ribosomal subunit interface protein
MDIIFSGRQTDVPARFRDYATAKLSKLGKLDQKTVRVEVEISVERNPRQSSQKERVELTVRSRGPAIRAEAAAEDRLAAFDLALAKLGTRLRRSVDRRKSHHADRGVDRALEAREPGTAWEPEGAGEPPAAISAGDIALPAQAGPRPAGPASRSAPDGSGALAESDSVVPIQMEGNGPLVVRQKVHRANPISIDQALLEMELVGHDFYLFHDIEEDMPSVVYRRRGYQYGVIRLVELSAERRQVTAEPAGRSRGNASTAAPR